MAFLKVHNNTMQLRQFLVPKSARSLTSVERQIKKQWATTNPVRNRSRRKVDEYVVSLGEKSVIRPVLLYSLLQSLNC